MPRENPETRERIRLLRVRDRAARAHLKALERTKVTEFVLAAAEKDMRAFDETALSSAVATIEAAVPAPLPSIPETDDVDVLRTHLTVLNGLLGGMKPGAPQEFEVASQIRMTWERITRIQETKP